MCRWLLCFALAMGASAQTATFCIDDKAGLNTFVRTAFDAEFRALFDSGEIRVAAECTGSEIPIVVQSYAPSRYSNALGLAYCNRDRVLPEIRIYTQPVLRALGNSRSAAILGRALARVAAHEALHYVNQQKHHHEEGLMRAAFTGPFLAGQ